MRHDIFATPFWHLEGAPQELIDELYQKAYEFKKRYKNVSKSNIGGYQTPPFKWEDFHPQGREYITSIVNDNLGKWEELDVKGWWYNINGKGDSNLPHTHPGSDMALVIYLTDSDGLLNFINPFSMRVVAMNEKHYCGVNAKKGDIIMFPSDIMHYVLPNPREEDRISISMNLQLS